MLATGHIMVPVTNPNVDKSETVIWNVGKKINSKSALLKDY